MQLTEESGPAGVSQLAVSGEVDMSNAGELRDAGISAVSADDCQELAIDLSGVSFMDSSGLGALVAIRSAATDLSRVVRISAASTRVRQVIEVCGLGPEFGLDAHNSVSTSE